MTDIYNYANIHVLNNTIAVYFVNICLEYELGQRKLAGNKGEVLITCKISDDRSQGAFMKYTAVLLFI